MESRVGRDILGIFSTLCHNVMAKNKTKQTKNKQKTPFPGNLKSIQCHALLLSDVPKQSTSSYAHLVCMRFFIVDVYAYKDRNVL